MSSIRKRTWTSRGGERTCWVVDYRDQHGRRHLKSFGTRKLADAWCVEALHQVKARTHTASTTSITVARAGELWIEQNLQDGLERSTIEQRRQHLRLHINPFLGSTKLSDLSTPDFYVFDSQLRTAGRSLAMRKKVITNIKIILSHAKRLGYVAQNVALGVRIGSKAERDETAPLRAGVDFPTHAELRTLMETATGRWRPLLICGIFTGMRASELRGLTWANVDLGAGVIRVRQRADAWGVLGRPKSTAGIRDIPVPPIVVNTLAAWKTECPVGELDLVFPNGAGRVEFLENIGRRFWLPLQFKCGIVTQEGKARYNFHMLRHAAASLFIQHLRWSPKKLQTVMGHSSITMTFDRYGHMFDDLEADREDMKKIEAAIVAA